MYTFRTGPRRAKADPISEVLGDVRYAAPYYPKGLTETTLGVHSRFPLGVSRFYLFTAPPTVVDFEPGPLDDVPVFHCEAKRQWCHVHRIAYVPVFLRERLTVEMFEARLTIEREALAEATKTQNVVKALDAGTTPGIGDEEFNRLVDQEALARLKVVEAHMRSKGGSARLHRLRRLRLQVETEFRKKERHGELGRYVSYLQPALAAR